MGRAGNALVAAGALLCALAPASLGLGTLLLGIGRLATGLGAGGAEIAIMVSVLARVDESSRAEASVLMWTGMAAAILGCGLGAAWLLQPGAWRWSFAAAAFVAMVLTVGFPMQASAAQASAGPVCRYQRWSDRVGKASFDGGSVGLAVMCDGDLEL